MPNWPYGYGTLLLYMGIIPNQHRIPSYHPNSQKNIFMSCPYTNLFQLFACTSCIMPQKSKHAIANQRPHGADRVLGSG